MPGLPHPHRPHPLGWVGAMNCPHCGSVFDPQETVKFGVEKGGLSLPSDLSREETERRNQKETPKFPKRGRAREYTAAFDAAWKAYGRKDQKFEAFAVWIIRSREVGGEAELLSLILSALKWQSKPWAEEGWKFAPYFERYLKRRKWEDEQPAAAPARPTVVPIKTFAQQAADRQADAALDARLESAFERARR
jgi:hypothetical protein